MENTKLNTKVERYIELSIKFQKSAEDLFGKESQSNYIIHGETTIYNSCNSATGYTSNNQNSTPPVKSRAEKIREKAETEAKLAEEYEEYIQLQRDLKQYYNALNKIENN